MKKVLYVLLPQFAEHELPYLTQPLRSDAMAMKENPKYENKIVAETMEPVEAISGFRVLPDYTFNTVGLFTTDNVKMVAFYRDIFGFHTEWNGSDPNVEMTLGDSRIIMFPRDAFELMTSQQYAYPQGVNGTMEISFDVPCFADVDKEYELAESMGAKPIFAPTTEPWGQRTCYVADPEGNLIEISSFFE